MRGIRISRLKHVLSLGQRNSGAVILDIETPLVQGSDDGGYVAVGAFDSVRE